GGAPWRGGSSSRPAAGGAVATDGTTGTGSPTGSGCTGATVGTSGGGGIGGTSTAAGIACCATCCAVDSVFATAACAAETICWTTSPSSPGLAIRTDTFTLHEMQTVTPATVIGGGGAPLQLQCQFHTITVVPGGTAGADGAGSSGSQFHVQ